MIINAKIDNFLGIEKEININMIANNRIKRTNSSHINIEKNINLLKTIGIIGSNASGKTSILKAFYTIQKFVNFPFRKSTKENQEIIEQIKYLPKEILEELLSNFNTLDLPEQNINRFNEDTTIELEFFIPDKDKTIHGFYTYKLIYDRHYKENGIKEESLFYRKKYSSTKKKCIFLVNNIFESELGTKMLYLNNTINEKINNIQYYQTLENEIRNKMIFSFDNDSINLIDTYKKNTKRFRMLCHIADDKIIDTRLEKNENNEEIVFINANNNKLTFEQLSNGTKKILVLGNKIIHALENNKIIFVDELEAALHPTLSNFLVLLMQYKYNNSFSQLIFSTHSVYLAMLIDNDQLYYIDNHKNKYELNNINDAIKDTTNKMTKDKTLTSAMLDNLLIKNPDLNEIYEFLKEHD